MRTLLILTSLTFSMIHSCMWQEISISDEIDESAIEKRERDDSYSYDNTEKLKRELKALSKWRIKYLNEDEADKINRETTDIVIKGDLYRELTNYSQDFQVWIREAREYYSSFEGTYAFLVKLKKDAALEDFYSYGDGSVHVPIESFLYRINMLISLYKNSYKITQKPGTLENYARDIGFNVRDFQIKKNKILKKLIYRFPYLDLDKMASFADFE